MPENEVGERGITDMQMRQRDVAALDAKYTKELAMLKPEMMPAWWRYAGRRRLHIKAVCQSVREATTASGVELMQPPDWQTPLNGLFHLRERLDHYAKTTEEPRSILMSSADRVAHIMGQLMHYCEQYTIRFQRSINA